MHGIAAARMEWERLTELYVVERKKGSRTYKDDFRRFGDAIALLEWGSERCTISKLEALVLKDGAATRLLKLLQGISDEYDVPLWGNVIPYDPARPVDGTAPIAQDELEALYLKIGFRLHRGLDVVECFYP